MADDDELKPADRPESGADHPDLKRTNLAESDKGK